MSFPSADLSVSVARYVVDANKTVTAPVDVLAWAQPIVAAHEPVAAAAKPKAVRKAKVTKAADALLTPVDAPVAVVAAAPAVVAAASAVVAAASAVVAAPISDLLKNHKYRLQSIDTSLCMARKIDEANPIPGTRKGDEGATKMFWPEKQCSRKPIAGQALCKMCASKEVDIKADKQVKQWYGRLDEPLIHAAMVIGCGQFYEKYPMGLLADPTTAPPAMAVVETKKGAKKGGKAKAVAPLAPSAETVAVTDETVPEAEWVTFLYKSQPLIRNLKTQKVYEVDPHKITHQEMVKMDKCVGRWVDGELDPYGAGDDDDEE